MKISRFAAAVYCAGFIAVSCGSSAHAIEGYWHGDVNIDWNTGIVQNKSNWYSQPGGAGSLRNVPDFTARFAAGTNKNTLVIREATSIGRISFEAGTPIYLFRITEDGWLRIGSGITNQSDRTQVFRIHGPQAEISLEGVAQITGTSAPAAEIITSDKGTLAFFGTSRGGNAVVSNTNNGVVSFRGESSAEQMTITNRTKGRVFFAQKATASRAEIINGADSGFYCQIAPPFTLPVGRFSNSGLADVGECTMKVARSYSQTANGTLLLRVLSLARVGRIVTTQNATLGGALQVYIDPDVPFTQSRSFKIVQAGGRRIGSFASLTVQGRNDVTARLAYSQTGVNLIVQPK